MNIHFSKLQGTGNDFILLNYLSEDFNLNSSQIRLLCDRHFGIGGDGILLLTQHETADFELVFYNPDGSISFCGNGSRCAAKYFMNTKNISNCTFYAYDGMHEASLGKYSQVTIDLRVKGKPEEAVAGTFINTGAPHVCVPIKDVIKYDITTRAKDIRWSKQYLPTGVNVNFYELLDSETVSMRTYEKGVEGETLSCGTGVTAVAITIFKDRPEMQSINVKTKGGMLKVERDPKDDNRFWLTGSVIKVFTGQIVF